MSTSFAQLKKNRKQNFEKLSQELEKAAGKDNNYNDERMWYPAVDKAGNGYAIIRFLPASKGEDLPVVRVFEHAFQSDNGSWLIEKCPTTLGGNHKCPVCEYNSKLWNSGYEADKDQARRQKRNLNYYSNIYVIEDPKNPENEGKVFLFRYGKKIFDKIYEANHPEFQDETPIDPFDPWEGANFKIKIRQKDGFRNYDSSSFEAASQLFDDEDKIEAVWNKQHPLAEFTDPKQFKSYAEIKKRLNAVLGEGNDEGADESVGDEPEPEEKPKQQKVKKPDPEPEEESPFKDDSESEEDDDMALFEKIANEDDEDLIS